jgi:teichuronic acid biosynthesis glycosyltransferase TuaC
MTSSLRAFARGNFVQKPINIVTFTTLYPNSVQPSHGVFVENRLRHLLASGQVTGRVVAPVPWFPSALAGLSAQYGAHSMVPATELRVGIDIFHPRYLVLPNIGMTLAPALLFARSLPVLRRLRDDGQGFDLIDAHYFYPDGVAAALLGQALRKPVVITARGSDVNLFPRYALPRAMIRSAARNAAGVIAVSQALKDRLVALGVPPDHVRVLRNGVDLEAFHAGDRDAARLKLGLGRPTLLSVAGLVELKGHDLMIEALTLLPDHLLLLAGEGPERSRLERLAARLSVTDRVRFLGLVPHRELASIYSAADALLLASSREGWPNVLLESMACGTPVAATAVGGVPEVVTQPEAGVLISQRTPAGIAAAVRELFAALPCRADTRRYAENFSWNETTRGQIKVFSEILACAS